MSRSIWMWDSIHFTRRRGLIRSSATVNCTPNCAAASTPKASNSDYSAPTVTTGTSTRWRNSPRAASNIYYAYELLCRYAPRGGKLRRLEMTPNPHVHGVAIEYPAGDLTILLVNDQPGEQILFELADAPARPLVAWQTDATYKHRA